MRHNIKLLALLCGTIYGSAQNDYKGKVGNTQTPAVTLDVSRNLLT